MARSLPLCVATHIADRQVGATVAGPDGTHSGPTAVGTWTPQFEQESVVTMRTPIAMLVSLLSLTAQAAQNDVDLVDTIYEQSSFQGGLVVELGFVDAQFTASLGGRDAVTLHTLDTDPQRVADGRNALESLGVYGKITLEQFSGKRLPFADNLVNLLVWHDAGEEREGVTISREEIMRVLAPGGVVCSGVTRSGPARLQMTRKPWPEEIDQWTHFLHGAEGNAVAADQRVAPATALQWIVEPKYCRSHEIDSSLPAMVSANGRLFYFLDEGPIGITDPRFPARWVLECPGCV